MVPKRAATKGVAALRPPETTVPPASQGRGDAAIARVHTGDALATLVAIMGNGDAPATARVSAANAVLDRAWGKPRQDFEFSSAGDAVAAIQRARLRVHRLPGARHKADATHGDAGKTDGATDSKDTSTDG
jgi:hypothetical protein